LRLKRASWNFEPRRKDIPRIAGVSFPGGAIFGSVKKDALVPANAGLFHYAGNNPVRYIDPDGKKIVFCKSATAEQIKSYETAVFYLKQSARAKELIEKLEGAPEVFTIDFIESTNERYDWDSKTIKWNPKNGLIVKSEEKSSGVTGGLQSPALGLAHEMGHAEQDILGTFNKYSDETECERDNLDRNEIIIANELNEPVRQNYKDCVDFITVPEVNMSFKVKKIEEN